MQILILSKFVEPIFPYFCGIRPYKLSKAGLDQLQFIIVKLVLLTKSDSLNFEFYKWSFHVKYTPAMKWNDRRRTKNGNKDSVSISIFCRCNGHFDLCTKWKQQYTFWNVDGYRCINLEKLISHCVWFTMEAASFRQVVYQFVSFRYTEPI